VSLSPGFEEHHRGQVLGARPITAPAEQVVVNGASMPLEENPERVGITFMHSSCPEVSV
jgi:hypothetical protein